MVFLVVMYAYENWTIKKAECRRIDVCELWCWRRLLRVPWTARRSNQSILKEISPEYSLKELMLKLKLQYVGHLMQRPWCWERLKEGREGDDRRWSQMASPTQRIWVWVNSRSWWWTGRPGILQSMGLQRVRHDWTTELNWTGPLLLVILDPAFLCQWLISHLLWPKVSACFYPPAHLFHPKCPEFYFFRVPTLCTERDMASQ